MIAIERINGLGDAAEEWADVNVRPGMRDVFAGQDGAANELESTFLIASRLIVAWSLKDAEGNPLPITPETVGNVDASFTWPVIKRIKRLPFLASLGR